MSVVALNGMRTMLINMTCNVCASASDTVPVDSTTPNLDESGIDVVASDASDDDAQ